MKLFYNSWIFCLPILRNYNAICLGRCIFFAEEKGKVSQALLDHELTHQRQMDVHGVINFYFIYVRDYVRNRLSGMDHDKAYAEIPFEKQAHTLENYNPRV